MVASRGRSRGWWHSEGGIVVPRGWRCGVQRGAQRATWWHSECSMVALRGGHRGTQRGASWCLDSHPLFCSQGLCFLSNLACYLQGRWAIPSRVRVRPVRHMRDPVMCIRDLMMCPKHPHKPINKPIAPIHSINGLYGCRLMQGPTRLMQGPTRLMQGATRHGALNSLLLQSSCPWCTFLCWVVS